MTLANADALIASLNAARDDGAIDYLTHDVFNCTAVGAIVEPGRATIGCLGDAAALLQSRRGSACLLTDFQTDRAEALRDDELRDRPEHDRVLLFRTELRNRAEPWRGRSDMGFGVLDGTGRYAALVQWCEVMLHAGDRLYLASDTVARALAEQSRLPDRPTECFELARAWEQQRGITKVDDLTVVIVEA